jgi:hypothetical protein
MTRNHPAKIEALERNTQIAGTTIAVVPTGLEMDVWTKAVLGRKISHPVDLELSRRMLKK